MKKIVFSLFFIGVLCNTYSQDFISKFTAQELKNAPVKLIPYPQKVIWGNQLILLEKVEIEENHFLSNSNRDELFKILKNNNVKAIKSTFKIVFQKDKTLGKEEYFLRVDKHQILIKSANEKGQFYALQTLRQLIRKSKIQLCTIWDKPTCSIRGFMTDVGRNYQSLSMLKNIIDIMASYKMNTFHWHLTDRPAWRIESHKYPELTDAKNHRETRNPGKFYTYKEIREFCDYAKKKQIQVIPEIDMPGHSDSFTKSMGVKMASEKGRVILENILNEFFSEVPKELCPIVHIGSDEVRIKNPDEFIQKMVSICKSNGRKVIVWNPGLKADTSVIRQTWKPDYIKGNGYTEIDSWNNYINNGDPFVHISKLFFKPIGYKSKNNVKGGILCLWHDVNVTDEKEIILANPVFPSILTYAWTTWTADVKKASEKYKTTIPTKGSKENTYFSAFEDYLIAHKKRYFDNDNSIFPYHKQSNTVWKLIGPFASDTKKKYSEVQKLFDTEQGVKATGNTIYIRDRFKLGGHFPKAKPGETYYAKTIIYSDREQTKDVWIGFETPFRANRVYGGMPSQGSWDSHKGTVWLNGKVLPSPIWEKPNWKPSKTEGWGTPKDQETPWAKEELYWTRKPVKVKLKKGINEIIFKVPGTSEYQNWMFTFSILDTEGIFYKDF